MNKINESTVSMSTKILNELGIQSIIDVPKDLRVLFSALDFTTKHNDFHIPLQKRGDGLQTRHIPYILDFVARRSKTHHIWAYEEPENSLEIGKAYELARQFKTEFSKDNQIFITTHSPAFYDISGDVAKRFHVYQDKRNNDSDMFSHTAVITSRNEADSFVGTAAFIATRVKSLIEEHKELKNSHLELKKRLQESNLPQIVVEGPTDKIIFDKAIEVLFPNDSFCEIISANCATKLQSYLEASNYVSKDTSLPIIGIFDNDMEGRVAYQKIKNVRSLEGMTGKVISTPKKIYALLLPLSDEINTIQEAINENMDGTFNVSVPIEFMFPSGVLNSAINDGAIELEHITTNARDRDTIIPTNITEIVSQHIEKEEYRHLAMKINDSTKGSFANWICEQPDETFTPLKEFLEQVKVLCQT